MAELTTRINSENSPVKLIKWYAYFGSSLLTDLLSNLKALTNGSVGS